jgi:hypothetical protein
LQPLREDLDKLHPMCEDLQQLSATLRLVIGRNSPPNLEHVFAVVQFSQLGLNGCSLTSEFVLSLCRPTLGVCL